ncbi:branched-chain amino acid aminotransferase [Saccharopolyspora erythraea NRRL 2338]|uniref:Branched-chain-amino-acid aminotransferase n=2 Tax=Saccharopolyspora erythraea TaxID=1836 RepID=A4FA90_SACEN|nr:branched-chain amino acid aminotransferase [Saccharopolyspora erythraea]EQD81341.1 branched-chain amino acid aminotransferase [Saccharopolyspora erythraea D]PFG94751.1 branched-chain amino acid aminotransferase [Saccharopolyspora erythraea NRRL 2338]QRK91473.1 branched-chain amino acid aminotransferase [Saccharopolyspora erythraea]CAM00965.1 branched-chain amino acid aminotransferase [Saccharopolyspora erythraea NRRL 2338]
MTEALSFTRNTNPNPASDQRRAEVLANPGFGQYFTDHMVTIRWSAEQGWHDARLEPYHSLELDPATTVLHYAQAIFEGLKAYEQPDGSVAAFRPDANARRFQRSAQRIAMPELPEELFVDSLRELVGADRGWVPTEHESSLYLRPFMISTEASLGVNRPANSYLYSVIASPAGSYFAGGIKPVTVWLGHEYVRAAPGGTGAAKFAGNYAASFVAQAQAVAKGCDQVVWLDAVERRAVEEMGGMNLFFVFGSGSDARLVTPALTGSLLPGITRSSLLRLGEELGMQVEERRITTDEWEKKAASGELTEVFACGTAAVITPVGHVKSEDAEFTIADGRPGTVTMALREKLTGIQHGTVEDTHGWMTKLV